MKVSKPALKKLSGVLYSLSKEYHAAIPLGVMFAACEEAGLKPVCEDGTPWSGFLCGAEGRASIDLADSKKCLIVGWYKMPSGRYEVNAYVS